MRLNTKGASLATERHQKITADVADTAKVVSFIDLAGHERYLRTTVYGLTAHEPDYVMVVVGANHGITRMTQEHVGMAIALNVPLFVVVTKVDLCPEPVMKETMKQLSRLLKLPGARKQPYAVRSTDDLMLAVRGFGKSAITPVFTISSVDGTNVPLLRQFFNLMPSRRSWVAKDELPTEFLIDQFFNVAGVGLVVAGTLLTGLVSINNSLLMGPNNQGKFNLVTVKSIHHMRTAVRLPPPLSLHRGTLLASLALLTRARVPACAGARAASWADGRLRGALKNEGARTHLRHSQGDGPPRCVAQADCHKKLHVRRPRAALTDDHESQLPADPVRAERAPVRAHRRDGQGGAKNGRACKGDLRVHVQAGVFAKWHQGPLHRGQDQGDRNNHGAR